MKITEAKKNIQENAVLKIAIVSRDKSQLADIISHLCLEHLGIQPTLINLRIPLKELIGLALRISQRHGIIGFSYFIVSKWMETRVIKRYKKSLKIFDRLPVKRFKAQSAELVTYLVTEEFEVIVLGQNMILPTTFLEAAGPRVINVHPARLPEYRGYAEPAHALFASRPQDIGFSIHLVCSGVDSGSLIEFVRVEIGEDDSLNASLTRVRVKGYETLFHNIAEKGLSNYLQMASRQNEEFAKKVNILPYKIRLAMDLRLTRSRIFRKLGQVSR